MHNEKVKTKSESKSKSKRVGEGCARAQLAGWARRGGGAGVYVRGWGSSAHARWWGGGVARARAGGMRRACAPVGAQAGEKRAQVGTCRWGGGAGGGGGACTPALACNCPPSPCARPLPPPPCVQPPPPPPPTLFLFKDFFPGKLICRSLAKYSGKATIVVESYNIVLE